MQTIGDRFKALEDKLASGNVVGVIQRIEELEATVATLLEEIAAVRAGFAAVAPAKVAKSTTEVTG